MKAYVFIDPLKLLYLKLHDSINKLIFPCVEKSNIYIYDQEALFHFTLIKCNYTHLCLNYIWTKGQLLICTFALLNFL